VLFCVVLTFLLFNPLQEKQQVEQKRIEEEEMEREREFEQKILREITEEEEALDLIQEGGPNPKMIGV